ncbi:MAG: LysR family transcriptional regulator [Sneathiella sp.]|nr:LysR family transcriptional regulator [Sneathiella sp.]
MDWDDVRFFLTLARLGSVRAAGAELGVSHSTVARRIDQFEQKMGVRLFDRTPSGYVVTAAGEDMLGSAAQMEIEMSGLERRLLGQDTRLEGQISVTFPDSLTSDILMPDIVSFNRQYPDIDLELVLSYRVFDLSKREADIALRSLRCDSSPPPHLIGRKLTSVHYAHYASKAYLKEHDFQGDTPTASWIRWDDSGRFPKWIQDSLLPEMPGKNNLANGMMQLQAAKAGLGVASLPCFAADREQDLVRLPGSINTPHFDMWILSHPDLRETTRLRLFRDHITKAILQKAPLYEGRQPYVLSS